MSCHILAWYKQLYSIICKFATVKTLYSAKLDTMPHNRKKKLRLGLTSRLTLNHAHLYRVTIKVPNSVWTHYLSRPDNEFHGSTDLNPRTSDLDVHANFSNMSISQGCRGDDISIPIPIPYHRNPHWNPHGNPHTHGTRSKYSITCRPTVPHRHILAVC